VTRAARSLLLCVLVLACGPREAEPPRHLVLVTIDTLRRDHVGVYGHPADITPNLDALARRGVRLDDALAQSIATSPSHASMLTGLYPQRHGLLRLRDQRLPEANRTLAEILRGQGFSTAGFVSGPPLRRGSRLDQGFDHYDDELGPARERRAEDTNARVAAWLVGREDARLFLWVHYFDPHRDYDPPDSYRETGGLTGEVAPGVGSVLSNLNPHTQGPLFANELSEKAIRRGRALYAEEVHYTDRALGALLRRLDDHGLLDDAIVAVVSDHGEGLGERGYYFGHWDVLDHTARIPMVLAHPAGRFAGRIVEAPVGTIDLVPTLLAWLELPIPDGLDGRDLTPLLSGGPGAETLRHRPIYTEQREFFPARALRSASWSLIERPGSPEGGALEPRGAAPAGQDAARARRRLDAAMERIVNTQGYEPDPRELSEEARKKLEQLGYVR